MVAGRRKSFGMNRSSILVLGGARSGKSSFAERLAHESALDRVNVATATAGDEEKCERIARHRALRGDGWSTVE
jgi:adenosylcobinamide kinase / adenosylcobinamide-phosphate guanylyltransferase